MSESRAAIAELDQFYPPCGPCAFCGHRDKRHRLWDMFMNRNETTTEIQSSYPQHEREHIEVVRRIQPYKRKLIVFPEEVTK